jgi:hypothetical protein
MNRDINVTFHLDPDFLAVVNRYLDQSDDRAKAIELTADVQKRTAALSEAMANPPAP